MPTQDVYWAWHKTAEGGRGFTDFQHWAIRVGDIWYENKNSSDTKPDFLVDFLTHNALKQELVAQTRTAPFRQLRIGSTNATHTQIDEWMKGYAVGRTYDVKASSAGEPGTEGPNVGNCQTLVWFLAQKMGCLDERMTGQKFNLIVNIGYSYPEAEVLKIPQPGSAPKGKCSVLRGGMCTGSMGGSLFSGPYTSEWCGRCGYWYCPYHATSSDRVGPVGPFHVCYTNPT